VQREVYRIIMVSDVMCVVLTHTHTCVACVHVSVSFILQRPILLKGHNRPITFIKFNRDGDLLFSAAKDYQVTVWYTHNGERLGTYNGHAGAVWCLDVNCKLSVLIYAFVCCVMCNNCDVMIAHTTNRGHSTTLVQGTLQDSSRDQVTPLPNYGVVKPARNYSSLNMIPVVFAA